MSARSAEEVRFLIHHVVLPPKLPQAADSDPHLERVLLDTAAETLEKLYGTVAANHTRAAQRVASVRLAIRNLINSRADSGYVAESQLATLLHSVASGVAPGALPLEIKAQNAGIVVSKLGTNVTFEVFELSPLNEIVMGTTGRLVRSFPAYACRIPAFALLEKGLIEALSYGIAKMSVQEVPEFRPQVRKAKKDLAEIRNTMHPGLVTDYLVNVLAALGQSVDVHAISKNTRDDVLWCDAFQPWRRSPLWLLARVAMQLEFARDGADRDGNNLYKVVMVNLLAGVLAMAKRHYAHIGPDLLHCVAAKLARRLRKMKDLQPQPFHQLCTNSARVILTNTYNFMNAKWTALVDNPALDIDIAVVGGLQPARHLEIRLPLLDKFIRRISRREAFTGATAFRPPWNFSTCPENKLPSGLIGTKAQNPSYLFQLAAVEKWVEDHLDAWVDEHIEEETSCERLRCLIQEYYGHANPTYTSEADPRSISIMYLTLAELWAACDRCTCKMNPLLCEYDPEVTLEQLQSLALPFGSQLGRLDRLERYVKSRRSATDQSRPSLFSDFGHPKSFAVRYFDQSPKHQLLRVRVEEQAEVQRQEKLQELAHKRTQHDDLMARSDAMMCEYYEVVYDHYNNFTRQQHSYSCNKCALRKEAAQIQISVHEWPLSSNSGEAKATIFELQIPASLSNWRDATMFLMVDVFRYVRTPRRREARAHFTLRRDNVLNNYQAIPSKQRVVILSEAKPHTGSHYKLKQGASFQSEADVCVNNGLQYRYYDAICCTFMDPLQPTDHVSKKCTYQLPHRSSKLQRYLRTPGALGGLTPNSVMATLHDCPAHMSVDEYKAFGALGVGYNICYLNILAQLAMPTVDFAKVETQCLVLHTIHLAGPPLKLGSAERVTPEPVTRQRVTHGPLTNENFCRALMRELEAGLSRASENWEMWRALSTFVQLAQRVLSLNPPFDIRPRCLAYLEASRRTVLGWMETLGQRSRVATDDEQRAELCSRITEVALLCASTFDVDNANLSDVLGSPSAASALIQSSIVIQENSQATSPEHHQVYRSMMQSWRRLLFRVFPLLRRGILTGSIQDGLNVAVTASWAAFRPTGTWRGLEIPHHHWIQVQSENLDVHYNLLTAELLVRGLPLARLPEQYTGHGLYKSLFKQTSMDVMPTDEPGMAFSAKHPYAEYELSLGMDGPDMLLVAAAPTKANKFDLVPSRLFQDALPLAFTEAYLQWYDHSADQVEFRPRDSPWSAGGADIWRLRRVDSSWHLVKGQRSFVNPASRTGRALSGIFAPIETAPHVHVVYEALTNTVSVDLPRLQMEFYFDIGHSLLHSRQYRGMFIDPNQRIGSLIGLSSKLVLKHIHQADDRLVLIPEGRVTLNTVSDSVQVSIDANTTIKIHAYQIDNTLGRIVDNGSVESKLVLCHLHALTSHCLPDTLTGRTGTEAALSILRSAAVRSFTVLAPHHLELLELIAGLAPERRFYPDHLRVMQSVQWNERLCFMSQHPDFYLEVQGILEEARKARFFHPEEDGDGEPRRLAFTERDLVLRDMIRSSSFRVDGYGAEHFTTAFDQVHRERNRIGLQRGERTFIAASLVLRCRQALHSRVNAAKFQHSLRNVYFKKRTVQGPGDRLPPSTFKFDLGLLNEPSSFLPEMWCCLHSSMSKLPPRYNRFDVMIWLSTAAFAQSADMDLIQAFAAFYTLPELASITIPPVVLFKLAEGDDAPMSKVENALMPHMHPLQSCPESRMQKRDGESLVDWMRRKENRYRTNQDLVIRKFTDAIHSQWPCATPTKVAVTNADVYIDTNQAMSSIRPMFQAWHDNRRFFLYLEQVAVILERQQVSPVSVTPPREMAPRRCSSGETSSSRYFGVKDIFALNPPLPRSPSSPSSTTSPCGNIRCWPQAPEEPKLPLAERAPCERRTDVIDQLDELCNALDTQASSVCEKDYVTDLRRGCELLAVRKTESLLRIDKPDRETVALLRDYLEECTRYLLRLDSLFLKAVQLGDGDAEVCLSPRICRVFWLQQLNRDRFETLSEDWKRAIVKYALTITELQRARRLVALSEHMQDLVGEISNRGHQNWDPLDFPETLLLEAESGILVRQVQEEIARQMRSPPNGVNSVMQLNMGEGKSSVIVPIVAAAMADSKSLVRIIVAKPQSKQMHQMLVSKLGGLLNRRVYHLPFSRALKLGAAEADILGDMYEECMAKRGVMLVQPEHMLSFKLMGIECLLGGKTKVARSLLSTQNLLDTKSRDIVDESDENFSVRFELTYTMGTQKAVEMSPERWTIVHSMLDLIWKYASAVKTKLPYSIEVDDQRKGRRPRVRILRNDAEAMLLDLIARHICETGFPGLAVARQPKSVQDAIYRYIRIAELSPEEIGAVEQGPFWTESAKGPLWLVRGLIACGVLRFALGSKRWRVNYGLDPSRSPATRLAVPYRSKDCPSPRSEFSHPDVVITLTSLSYYYGGLCDEELFDTFAHLLKSDQADIEYGEWVRSTAPLPEAFRRLTGVNIKDRFQCTSHVFPLLRYSKGAIDYFLSHIVFPKEMKEFPQKLAASGWDIGAVKPKPTTGFSGTNDSRHVLPLSVEHLDLAEVKHTNAMVLAYILQDENDVQLLAPRDTSEMSDAQHLLEMVKRMVPATRVILDVGAQIIELNNYQVAEAWLGMSNTQTTKAVVFFNDKEELSVLDRNGRVESLQISAFAKQLDECLVYLDEAHTRGTDLKLPRTCRAAVTLGANLTKDRLVQACMRMRKLGKGQSVVFCIPEEIQMKILEQTSKALASEIQVSDVLTWAVSETWADLRRSMPLWASQGRRFEQHKYLLRGVNTTLQQARKFLEEELQSIERRYRPRSRSDASIFNGWDLSNHDLGRIITRCKDFEALTFNSATLEEEQERELCPEIEEEREVQPPAPMKPAEHRLHPHLLSLIETGEVPAPSNAFTPAFQALESTSAARCFNLALFPAHLLVTADFMRTVERPTKSFSSSSYIQDRYLRPVQWILSVVAESEPFAVARRRLVVISPFEANLLVPIIVNSGLATLHLYAPRRNLGYDPLDDLDLFCIGRSFQPATVPRNQIVQLNLFAGQLYFWSYAEYKELCRALGLAYRAAEDGQVVQADGFVLPPIGKWALKKSPVQFLREFMKIRREGEGMEKTQLGKVLEGTLLEEGDFER